MLRLKKIIITAMIKYYDLYLTISFGVSYLQNKKLFVYLQNLFEMYSILYDFRYTCVVDVNYSNTYNLNYYFNIM